MDDGGDDMRTDRRCYCRLRSEMAVMVKFVEREEETT